MSFSVEAIQRQIKLNFQRMKSETMRRQKQIYFTFRILSENTSLVVNLLLLCPSNALPDCNLVGLVGWFINDTDTDSDTNTYSDTYTDTKINTDTNTTNTNTTNTDTTDTDTTNTNTTDTDTTDTDRSHPNTNTYTDTDTY